MENKETYSSNSGRIEGKIRTIRFILLSTILYFISDAIGRWFVPGQDSVPGMYSIMIWILCFITGALQFFFWRRIGLKWLRWTTAIAYIILMAMLLKWRGFFYYGGSTLIGYRLSVTIMPIWGFLIESTFTSFLKWYGNLIKRIFRLESIQSPVFLFFMLVPIAVTVMLLIGGYKLSGSMSDKGADLQQYIDEGEVNHNSDHREPVRQYDRLFNDLNDTQLQAARKNGLKSPITLRRPRTTASWRKLRPTAIM